MPDARDMTEDERRKMEARTLEAHNAFTLLLGAFTDRGYEDTGKLIRRIPIKLSHE